MPITAALDDSSWPDEIRAAGVERLAEAGDVLARIGTAPRFMFHVVHGSVQLARHGLQGQRLVLQRVDAGWVAEASLFSCRYHCDIVAAAPTRLVQVRVDAVRQALASSPRFSLYWIGTLSDELRRVRARCERLGLRRAEDRIVHAIELDGRDGTLRLDRSLKDWAAELGLTHEALYRGLARLEAAGRLTRGDGTLSLRVPAPGNPSRYSRQVPSSR